MTSTEDAAFGELLAALQGRGYAFVTPTPATHARVVAQPHRTPAQDLAGVLGWNLPFQPGALDPAILALLDRAGALMPAKGGLMRSAVRVSSLDGRLYLHSGFPTEDEDAVFFGPDSYRFAALIAAEVAGVPAAVRAIADIGTGAGVGAMTAATLCLGARVTGTDINPLALRFARINAAHARLAIDTVEGEMLAGADGPFDVILANPPYMADDGERAYRDGGGMIGGQISLDIARAALPRLTRDGKLILYTGSAIVDGRDALAEALAGAAQDHGAAFAYREIDPDVFGEELRKSNYRTVDRIAVVAAIFTAADRTLLERERASP